MPSRGRGAAEGSHQGALRQKEPPLKKRIGGGAKPGFILCGMIRGEILSCLDREYVRRGNVGFRAGPGFAFR